MRDEDCVFCKIVRGEIPCAKVHETDRVLSFLDLGPVRKGHCLVIPKAHYPTLLDLPEELAGLGDELLAAARKVGGAVMRAVGADGLNLGMNNFRAAGQLVPHAHLHVIPRHSGDGLSPWPQGAYETKREMDQLTEAIRRELA